MYNDFFQLRQSPFSIAPDPRTLYLSPRHREALAHLMYGAESDGGVVLLTGEIGAGKTTVCRCFLEQIPAHCNVAYIFNPKLDALELLQSICEEFGLLAAAQTPSDAPRPASIKQYIDLLNQFLLAAYARGRHTMLIIDEAQNLSIDVLEQLRLLTNLETHERKLLQIVLIGQPELRDMLARPELEQLTQRVIARYHLEPLSLAETAAYVQHRLAAAGLTQASPFGARLMKRLHRLTQGVPRRINLLCDRALLGAYARNSREVSRDMLQRAAAELFHAPPGKSSSESSSTSSPLRGGTTRRVLSGVGVVGATALALLVIAALAPQPRGPLADWPTRWQAALAMVRGNPPATAAASLATAAETASRDPLAAAQETPTALPASLTAATREAAAGQLRIDDEQEALRQLAALWEVELGEGDVCHAAEQRGLRCYRSSGGFAELRSLDRPVALRLLDARERPYYVLLIALADAQATLQVGALTQTVPSVLLADRFRGEFLTLWRSPPGNAQLVRLGQRGPQVDWIAQQLALLHHDSHPPAGAVFNKKMQDQLRDFQLAEGLAVDGVAGPVTLMRLNRVAGMREPRLRNASVQAGASLKLATGTATGTEVRETAGLAPVSEIAKAAPAEAR